MPADPRPLDALPPGVLDVLDRRIADAKARERPSLEVAPKLLAVLVAAARLVETDEGVALARAAGRGDGTLSDEEPPPWGTVPFGTMFIPGGGFIHGDNEWHEFPGPFTIPPKPTPGDGTLSDEDRTHLDRSTCPKCRAIIDRLAARVAALEEQSARYRAVLERVATTADTWEHETGGRAIVLLRIADEVDAALAGSGVGRDSSPASGGDHE